MAEKVEITIQANDLFSKVFGKASLQLKQLGDRARQVGKDLSLRLTAPLVGVGAAVLAVAASFEKNMNKVQAVTRASAEEMAAMEKIARELGATTQFSAGEAAEGLTFLSMAGFSAKESIAALPAVLDLAAASNEQLGFVADKVSNIMTQFGIDASETSRVTDILTETFTTSNTSMAQLADAMVFAGSVAGTFGISLEETSAALGILADSGKQASLGGTALRGMLVKLLAPTSQAAELMEGLGIKVVGTDDKLVSITEIIKQFESSAVTAGEIMTIFGQRAGPGMLDLLKVGSAALEENTQKLKESGGRAKEVADVQMKGLTGALKQMTSALQELALVIAKSGLLEWATSLITGFADLVRIIAEGNPKWFKLGVVLAGVAAAAGPLLIAIGLLLSPIGLIVAALVGAVGLIAAIAIFREEIGEKIISVIAKFMTILGDAGKVIGDFATNVSQGFLAATAVVKQFLDDIDEFLLGGLQTIIDGASEIIKSLVSPFEWLAEQLVGGSVVPEMVGEISGWFDTLNQNVTESADDMAQEVIGSFEEIDGAASDLAVSLGDIFAGIGTKFAGEFAGVSGAIAAGQATGGNPLAIAAGFVVELLLSNEKMREGIEAVNDVLVKLVDPIAEAVAPALLDLVPILEDFQPIFNLIGEMLQIVAPAISLIAGMVGGLTDGINRMAITTKQFDKNMMQFRNDFQTGMDGFGSDLQAWGDRIDMEWFGENSTWTKMMGEEGPMTVSLKGVSAAMEGLFGENSLIAQRLTWAFGTGSFLQKAFGDESVLSDVARGIERLDDDIKFFFGEGSAIAKIAKFIKKLVNKLGKLGGFEHGGRPSVGIASIVGEAGPELFVPDRPGTIIPNDQVKGMGSTINITVNAINPRESANEIARMLEEMAFLGRFNPRMA